MRSYIWMGYVVFWCFFFVIKQSIEAKGMEYRLWVEFLGYAIIWCVPVFLMGYGIVLFIKKGSKGKFVLFFTFIFYLFAAAVATFVVGVYALFNIKQENIMSDGTILVRVSDFPNESIKYYCEPVSIFARRRIDWTPERDASLLEGKYQVPFEVVTQENGEQIIRSKEEPKVIVEVWNKDPVEDNYVDNYKNLIIAQTIENKQIKTPFFDSNLNTGRESGIVNYTFICESKEDAEEVSKTIATMVQELMKRPIFEEYGENLYCQLKMKLGYTDIFFELGNRSFRDQDTPAMDYYADSKLVLEKILDYYEEDPEVYSTEEEFTNESEEYTYEYREEKTEEFTEGIIELDQEYSGDQWLIEVYETIYQDVFEKEGKILEFEFNAKGQMYVSFGMENSIRNTLVYDRESKNGKCYLVAYYEEHYDENGNWIDNTSIKNYYAVVKSSGQVIASGKTAWADVGTKEYRQATGE